jgi:MerR family transcriptional regulator, mercuric resistance operon regulatory protein
MTNKLTIGKLARELDINIETIRFYERKKLIRQPTKPIQGFRSYPLETLKRIQFIKFSQDLGFTLSEIKILLSLNDQPCGQVQELAEKKLASVRDKISDLNRLELALNGLLTQCESNQEKDHCPIIDTIHQ